MEGKMKETQGSENISTKLQRIAELARQRSGVALTTLAHHIDSEFLGEAYRRTRKDGAAGVDGQTAKEYAGQLEANLAALLGRFKSGDYRAPPVRRVHIPKGDGSKTRPIGVPTFEDKVLQSHSSTSSAAIGLGSLDAVYTRRVIADQYSLLVLVATDQRSLGLDHSNRLETKMVGKRARLVSLLRDLVELWPCQRTNTPRGRSCWTGTESGRAVIGWIQCRGCNQSGLNPAFMP